MSKIMQRLKADHVNIARLLDILEEQLEAVHDADDADFELIRDVMVYMTNYPDLMHHPLEDIVFARLRERDASSAAMVDDLRAEHEALAGQSIRLRNMLDHVVDGRMVLREELADAGRDYVQNLRRHLNKEEREVFALARDALTEQDWVAADNAMELRADPIFGPTVEAQYRTLFEHISQHVID